MALSQKFCCVETWANSGFHHHILRRRLAQQHNQGFTLKYRISRYYRNFRKRLGFSPHIIVEVAPRIPGKMREKCRSTFNSVKSSRIKSENLSAAGAFLEDRLWAIEISWPLIFHHHPLVATAETWQFIHTVTAGIRWGCVSPHSELRGSMSPHNVLRGTVRHYD